MKKEKNNKKEIEKTDKKELIKVKDKKKKEKKEKSTNKFIETIKKKWLVNTSKTFLLIVIIVAIFIAINIIMQSLDLTPLDFTQEKLYTLTEESKEKVKNIDKDVNLYFVGYAEEDTNYALARQYKNVNEKIVAQIININERPDLAKKYDIQSDAEGIIVECGEKYKILTSSDLETYDTKTYERISIAEEKFTGSILSVTEDKNPKIYFLEGYSDYELNTNMYGLNMYLENEIYEKEDLNLVTTGKVPDDCDTLIITNPSKDFDDITTKAIKDYINLGKNLLWLNTAIVEKQEFPNVNSILEMYGVKPFEIGVILETDADKMATGEPYIIRPDIEYSTITEDLKDTVGVLFANATKINIDEEKLEELKVEKTDLLQASEKAFFKTDLTNNSFSQKSGDETGSFIVGAELAKTISEANEETGENAKISKLIIFGDNNFISDFPILQNSEYSAFQLAYNKDLMLNSIAYLVDRPEDVAARKDTGTVTYTATELQDTIVKIIIFTVPILIIIAGIIVWQVRRRKK